MKSSQIIVFSTISLAMGIWIAKTYSIAFNFSTPFLILSIILCLYSFYRGSQKFAALFFFVFVFFAGTILSWNREAMMLKKALPGKDGDFVYVKALIVEPVEIKANRVEVEMEILQLKNDYTIARRKIRVLARYYIPENSPDALPQLTWGQVVKFSGLIRSPERPTNPGQFDYREYLRINGISGIILILHPEKIEVVGKKDINPVWSLAFAARKGIINVIKNSIPYPESALLIGMVLGISKELPQDLLEDYRKTGTLHVLAASGFNVSIIIAFFMLFLPKLGLKKNWVCLLTIPPIFFYAMMAEASPSIMRAAFMGSLFLLATIIRREYDPLISLFLAALGMLILNPYNLFLVSFQLSFCAVAGILILFNPLSSLFPTREILFEKLSTKYSIRFSSAVVSIYYYLLSCILISIVAQMAVFPIIAYHFNQASLINIVANLFMVPLAGAALPMGLIGGILGMIVFPVGKLLLLPFSYLLNWSISLISALAKAPFAAVPIASPDWSFFILYYGFLLILVAKCTLISKHRRLILGAIFLVSCAYIIYGINERAHLHRLIVFDCPRTGAILAEKKGNNTLIIYARKTRGRRERDEISWNVIPYLKKRGISRLSALFIVGENGAKTPPLDRLIMTLPPAKIFISQELLAANELISLQEKLKSASVTLNLLEQNKSIDLGRYNIDIPTSPHLPITLKYRWQNGTMFLLDSKSIEISSMQRWLPSDQVKILVYNYNPGIDIIENIACIEKMENLFQIVLFRTSREKKLEEKIEGTENLNPPSWSKNHKWLCPQRDGAIIFDLSKGKLERW